MVHKVLVVDDYESCRDLYSTALKCNGFEVATAGTAEEAQSKTLEFCPDLIVMDVNLPDSDGLITAAKLRSSSDTWRIPILAISGMAAESLQEEAVNHGCIEFLQKPFPLGVLVSKAKAILEAEKRKIPDKAC